MTDDELVVYTDPAIPRGYGFVGLRGGTPGVMWLQDEAGEAVQAKAFHLETQDVTLPWRQPTLDALSKAAFGIGQASHTMGRALGKTALQLKVFADQWRIRCARSRTRALRRTGRPRVLPPVPPIVPAGLSRVDSTRARSARSALLRSRRRAVRRNRALPARRPLTFVVHDPKITWGDPKRNFPNDRMDATLHALTVTPRKD
jgi:hypothetical protein